MYALSIRGSHLWYSLRALIVTYACVRAELNHKGKQQKEKERELKEMESALRLRSQSLDKKDEELSVTLEEIETDIASRKEELGRQQQMLDSKVRPTPTLPICLRKPHAQQFVVLV